MADATGDDQTESASGHQGPDRRRTVDLVRVERGEPERRKLRRPSEADLRRSQSRREGDSD